MTLKSGEGLLKSAGGFEPHAKWRYHPISHLFILVISDLKQRAAPTAFSSLGKRDAL